MDTTGYTPEDPEWAEGVCEALEWAHYHFTRLIEARNLGDQANALTNLSNSMHDLASWHPRYDIETGLIGEYDE